MVAEGRCSLGSGEGVIDLDFFGLNKARVLRDWENGWNVYQIGPKKSLKGVVFDVIGPFSPTYRPCSIIWYEI